MRASLGASTTFTRLGSGSRVLRRDQPAAWVPASFSQPHNPIAGFAHTNHRYSHRSFGIKREDRLSRRYVIGKTGAGKGTLIETMVRQDIERGEGLALIDPQGGLVAWIASVRFYPLTRSTAVARAICQHFASTEPFLSLIVP